MTPFSDPAHIASYAERTPLRVPGLTDLHKMAVVLLQERAKRDACILVLGAGGGLELRSFASARPDWSFVGVDPSRPMLDLAQTVIGDFATRVELMQGTVDNAPTWPFDGATCLLTLHFLTKPERLHILRELHKRLQPGAALIIAHHCKPDQGPVEQWLARSAIFGQNGGIDPVVAARSAAGMIGNLSLLTAKEEEDLLQEAGFLQPAMFYAGLSFRGWVAYASGT